ncbi:hypothetical protein PSYJYH_000020 [Bacillus phage PSYJ-YH]|nr:hypothetical protein PSYJYH_000020 [Bacillus phage PSYJ-YH]
MKIQYGKREREIPVRELSDAEANEAYKVSRIVYNKFKGNVPTHMRDEIESFLNEEAFFYTCKWDGERSLGGYLYNSLKFRLFSYIRDLNVANSKKFDNPEVCEDGENVFQMWDERPHEDDTSLEGMDALRERMSEREWLITCMLYEGYPLMEIADRIGKTVKTVQHIRKDIRYHVRQHYGDFSIGNNYPKRAGNINNLKRGS